MSDDLPDLRASHEDRDRVVDVLRAAAGDGRLSAGELDARLESALTARTLGELAEPTVIHYVAQAKECSSCGTVTEGELPAHVRARASYGPETCAQAANLTCGHYIPVHRATQLLCQLAGIRVSTGWMAGVRGRAARLVDRSAEAIDAGQVLPGYCGVIVRDGYAGYGHLTDALHAWCGAHLLRDLKGLYDFEPEKQEWASRMAGLLIGARDAAAAARLAGQAALAPAILDGLLTRYRDLATAGLAANLYRRTATESYLATAAKGGITKLDALRDLFRGHAWKPPGLQPAG